MAIKLPTTKLPAATQDPQNLIIYGLPKIGKTTVLSTLDDNLILDFECGSKYVSALKVEINSLKDFAEVYKALKESEHKYKFITIDTVTALEEFVKPLALKMYRDTPAGANYTGDILQAPMGIGYSFQRAAMESIIDKIKSVTDNIIIVGHVKDKSIISAEGKEVGSVKDFDLTGKAARIFAAKSDAIGFVHRDENSNLCINFETGGIASAGARPAHLANKDIIVAERQEDGAFISHWDRIYPSLKG